MRPLLTLFTIALLFRAEAQVALDGLFICERWLLNAEASVLEHHGVDRVMSFDHAERMRTYAVDEPYYWVKRIFLRIDPKDNPALTASVPADSILPFASIVNMAIDSGTIILWNDLDYNGADELRGKQPITNVPMILTVDFHIDTLSRMAVPHLAGLSVERPGGGYAHMYYPELSYVLRDHATRTKHGRITYDDLFKQFRFKATWLACDRIPSAFACTPIGPSLEQQSELDVLSELYLLERVLVRDAVLRKGRRSVTVDLHPFGPVKANVLFDQAGNLAEADLLKGERLVSSVHFTNGKPHGPYRAFYPDGQLREEGLFTNGLREGKWNSWFANATLRSHRTYQHGVLHGLQLVYHANGQLWLEYGMANGDYEGRHTTWYADGELKARGTMREGFISGEWDHAIRIDQVLMDELTRNNSTLYHLPDGVWQDGVVNYHITVTDNGKPGINSCLFGRCIQWAYSEVR